MSVCLRVTAMNVILGPVKCPIMALNVFVNEQEELEQAISVKYLNIKLIKNKKAIHLLNF